MATTIESRAVQLHEPQYRFCLHSAVGRQLITGLLLISSGASAKPVEITLVDAQYSTYAHMRAITCADKPLCEPSDVLIETTRTEAKTLDHPLSSEVSDSRGPLFLVSAKANADMFEVSTQTAANILPSSDAKANAKTVLSFSTFHDELAPLTLSAKGDGVDYYSDGLVSLYDNTDNRSLFAYGWRRPPPGVDAIPWDTTVPHRSASLALNTMLLASHVYTLTLDVSTDANQDGQWMSLKLDGLHPIAASVPEPSSYVLILAGTAVGVMLAIRRHRGGTVARFTGRLVPPTGPGNRC